MIVGQSKLAVEAKRISWGKTDKLPLDILQAILDSGTARKCWRKLDRFIQADGFSNVEAAKTSVNPSQTADELLGLISADYSYIGGFALRVKYSMALQAAEFYHVPIQTIRRLDNGNFIINPNFGLPGYKKDEDEEITPYNPSPDVVAKELQKGIPENGDLKAAKQTGQLWFVHRPIPGNVHYPVPDYWTLSGSKNILSSTEIAITDLDNLENNFTPPVIVFVPGNYDNTVKSEEDGLTQLERVQEQISSLTDKENRSKAVMLTGASREQAPVLTAWDNTKPILALDAKRETIDNAICRDFGVPPILVGLYKAGALSQSKEILNAIDLFQFEVNDYQREIQRVFEKLLPNTDPAYWIISTLSVLKELPQFVIDQLTPDEKRALGGYSEVEQEIETEASKTLKALQGLSPLVANKVLEQMSREQILALIGLKPDTTEPETTGTDAD